MSLNGLRGALGAAALICASTASAHVVLERADAPAGSSYRAVLRVTHGCKGSATTAIRVDLPEGAVGARPMAKPGWSIATVRRPYAKSYPGPHGTLTEGVREITWSGGMLPDDLFDEFTFSVQLSGDFRPGQAVPFPVVQTCETGEQRWVEIPAEGQSVHDLAAPAPAIRIVAAEGAPPRQAPPPARSTRLGDLTIESPWLRATPGGAQVAGGYLRVTNRGSSADKLVGASIPLASRGEVHAMTSDNGVMKMHPVEGGGLEIPPGGAVELKPGGYHLMFMGLRGGLTQGQSVKGTLVFEKAGTVDVTFEVGALGARGPDGSGGGHGQH